MEKQKEIAVVNKKARFDYEILETWVAGIVLTGTEIKSIRLHKASLVDCYCTMHEGEMFVQGMNIAEYDWGTYNNHKPKRERKLLLQKKELRKIERLLQDKGITMVGLKLFVNDKGLAKLLIGLGKGRKSYDKRDYIKDKDNKRELDRVKKAYK